MHEQSLLAISWPIMVQLAVGISGPVLDSWFLSRISDQAAAGVGATLPVFMLLQTTLNATSQAGAGIAGQYLGARRERLAEATFVLVLAVITGGGLVLGGLLSLCSGLVVLGLGLDGPTAGHAKVFLSLLGPGIVGRALLSALSCLLSARGLTQWNLWSSVATVGLNALLNALLVGGLFGLPCLGVPGVAISTVLSWAIVGAATLVLVVKRLGFRPSRRMLVLGWRRVLGHLVRIGLPALIEPVSYALFQVALAAQLARLGALALTARVYAMNLANLPVLFSLGLGFGAQILVSHLVGAGDHATADRRLRAALRWGIGLATVASIVIAISGKALLGWFTHDGDVVALGATLLWIDTALQPGKAANIAISFSLRAAGDSRYTAIVSTILMWTVGLGSAIGLAFGAKLGVIGLWTAMALDEGVRSFVNWHRWRSGAWKGKGVVLNGRA